MVNENRIQRYNNIITAASLIFLHYPKEEICKKLKISPRTLSDYKKRMREMGLLKIEHYPDGTSFTRFDFELLGILTNGMNVILREQMVSVLLPCREYKG